VVTSTLNAVFEEKGGGNRQYQISNIRSFLVNRAPGKNQEKKLTFFRQNSTIPVKAGF